MGPSLLDRILDPATERLGEGSPLGDWWELQRRCALHPERVSEALAEGGLRGALDASTAYRAWGSAPTEAGRRWLAERGWRAIPYSSALYPAALRAIADPPVLLWLRGQRDSLEHPRVAIVGARRCTRYGESAAESLSGSLARQGVAVVSGLARGIDAAAHRAALPVGRTLAVLAHGPDRLYPAAHRELAERIVRGGALLTEFPPGLEPRKPFFPLRNRVISGISQAVVVVEARRRSGSLATARHALAQGREVLAVPGPIDRATSEGANLLLRDGAAAALDASDVLRALPSILPSRAAAPLQRPARGETRALLRHLEEGPATLDELGDALGVGSAVIARIAVELEIAGLVATEPDGSIRLAPT